MRDLSTLQSTVVYLGAILLALVIVGYVLIRIVRSRIRSTKASESFTLSDLRALRAAGQLSDAEYERMRAMLIGSRPTAERTRRTGPAHDDET